MLFRRATTRTPDPIEISIVVPIRDERENLRPLQQSIAAVMEPLGRAYEIIFVDDGSSDGSVEALRELANDNPRVRIVIFQRNFGQTAALAAGFHHASGEIIATMDGDQQNDPADIPMMLNKLAEGYDLVHGWRKERQDALLHRRLPSILANQLIAAITGVRAHDLGCALKVMRRETALRLPLYGELHRFILVMARSQGARLVEVVTRHHPRKFGRAKYGLGRTLKVLLDLISVTFLIRHGDKPMRFFGRIALACGTVGVGCTLAVVSMQFLGNVAAWNNPLSMAAFALLLAGANFLGLGAVGELSARTFYQQQPSRAYDVSELVNFDHQPTTLQVIRAA
jgi:glycosyltransferase involved in cell wall biosynthesis